MNLIWRFLLAVVVLVSFCTGMEFVVLPLAVNLPGFWPGVLAALLSGIFVWISGLIYLEAVLASPPGANAFTISHSLINKPGTWFTSITFGYVHYAYLVSYFVIGVPIFTECLAYYFHFHLSLFWATVIMGLVFGGSIFLGTKWSLNLNFFLFIGLCVFYLYICFLGGSAVEGSLLGISHWVYLFFAIPSLFNTLYFQSILPTVANFLHYKRRTIRWAMGIGILISMSLLLSWLWLMIGSGFVVSITELFNSPLPLYKAYSKLYTIPQIGFLIPALLFLTVITSLLAVGLILVDFFTDLFSTHKLFHRLLICLLIFIPPMLLGALRNIHFMGYVYGLAGVGQFLLSTLIPLWWVWALRHREPNPTQLVRKKGFLLFFLLLSFLLFYLVVLLYLVGMQLIQQNVW